MNTSRILKDFGKLLKKNHQEIRQNLAGTETDCFRVYNHNIGIIPWYIDFYDTYVHISSKDDGTDKELKRLEPELLGEVSSKLYVPRERIRIKHRPKQGREGQHEKQGDEHLSFWVREYGLYFKVNLSDYIDTGLFLDHRLTRQLVRDASAGGKVLNLFGYTGGFTVNAAAGGALETVTVDLSKTYLSWARENMEKNGFIGNAHSYVEQDAGKYLQEAADRGEKYHLIIIDPPTFSNSRKMEGTFDNQRDYVWFIGTALSLLTKEGAVLFSSNKSRFHFDPGRLRGADIREITKETVPPDFPGKHVPHRCWIITPSPSSF
ncbi:MAG: class I SAM-dependent methyltransferase [Spirochaetaceae bacterium]